VDIQGVYLDPELAEEVRAKIRDYGIGERMPGSVDFGMAEHMEMHRSGPSSMADAFATEAIVRLYGRPALLIQGDTFVEPQSEIWRNRLSTARQGLEAAIRAVGRIELRDHDLDWVGTGWLVRDEVIVTNRHVAELFINRHGDKLMFCRNHLGREVGARLDFREEFGGGTALEYRLLEPIHIEDRSGPDMAFFRIEPDDAGRRGDPIILGGREEPETFVATIGYPAWDGHRNEPEQMRRVFNDIYNVKRLQPGQLRFQREFWVTHDCSTLGGNSGSAVIDLESGKASALHFGGRYREANYAVLGSVVSERLSNLGV